MAKINFYQTQLKDITKTFCKISEKCYNSNLNTLVVTENKDYLENIDKSLWTYSRKSFIPHATTNDPRVSDQPILITTIPKNLNNAKIIIFFDPTKKVILESITMDPGIDFNKIEKIIFIISDNNSFNTTKIRHILYTNKIYTSEINQFIKTSKYNWEKISIR